jgi:hypothetical protein
MRKFVVVSCCRFKKGGAQRNRMLILHSVAGRDHNSGIKAETPFTLQRETELHAHDRVVWAHGGSSVRVSRKFQNGKSCFPGRGLELGKRAHCQQRADQVGEVRQATLDRAGEDEEPCLSSKGRFGDECNCLVSTILHVCADGICAIGLPVATNLLSACWVSRMRAVC